MRITSSQGNTGDSLAWKNISDHGDKNKGIPQDREERKQPPALPQEQQCGFLGSIQENDSIILKISHNPARGP